MRFKNGLALFTPTNVKGSWNLASFHSPHSLTWRWLLAFSLFRGDEWRVWPIWMPDNRSNTGFRWTLRIPFVGFLRFDQQRPMWYRDIWSRQRDREDRERTAKSSHGHPTSRPNIVDGGQALH
jgi:hypothetical protein